MGDENDVLMHVHQHACKKKEKVRRSLSFSMYAVHSARVYAFFFLTLCSCINSQFFTSSPLHLFTNPSFSICHSYFQYLCHSFLLLISTQNLPLLSVIRCQMGGGMIFEHRDGQPVGDGMPNYRNILDGIKKATAPLTLLTPSSLALRDVDFERYELCLDLGDPYFILLPKDPDTHKVLSRMHARRMSFYAKYLLHPWLEKLSNTFSCFSLEYFDGYHGYGSEIPGYDFIDVEHESSKSEFYKSSKSEFYESYKSEFCGYDEDWSPDFTACSNDDCGMCGECDY